MPTSIQATRADIDPTGHSVSPIIASHVAESSVEQPIDLSSGLPYSRVGTVIFRYCCGVLAWHPWRAFGSSWFLLVGSYFVIGTLATQVKMAQKEAQGFAEKRKGRRGPGSVIGSSAEGCVCAFLSIYGVGGAAFTHLWELGFVASFCTKLSDAVLNKIGKAYGKTTYLVTTFKIVPRGTEGAISCCWTFSFDSSCFCWLQLSRTW